MEQILSIKIDLKLEHIKLKVKIVKVQNVRIGVCLPVKLSDTTVRSNCIFRFSTTLAHAVLK